jgi:hypothetical protein
MDSPSWRIDEHSSAAVSCFSEDFSCDSMRVACCSESKRISRGSRPELSSALLTGGAPEHECVVSAFATEKEGC